MGLETATYIHELNANNPVGATDPKSQGDDHLRLVKSTLQNTLPNVEGEVTSSHTELNYLDGATGVTGTGNTVRSISPTLTGTVDTEDIDAQLIVAVNVTAAIDAPAGTVGAPSVSVGALDNGLYSNGTDQLAFSTNGTLAGFIDASGRTRWIDGSVSQPAYSFSSDSNTGIYLSAADTMQLVANGANKLTVTSTAVVSRVTHGFQDGSQATPALNFDADSDTGMYRIASGDIAFSGDNTTLLRINATFASFNTAQIFSVDGTSSNPGFSFASDQNVGFYRSTTDTVAVSHGGNAGAVGFRDGGRSIITAGTHSITQEHAGKVVQYNGTTTTVTVPTTGVSENMMVTLLNSGSGNVTIQPSSGQIAFFNGASVTTGNRTLAPGGVCVVMCNPANTDAYIWGNAGLS